MKTTIITQIHTIMNRYTKSLCAFFFSVGLCAHAWAGDVTFTAGTNTGSTSVTVSPITMSVTGSNPGDLSGNPYKVYGGKTLNFSIASGMGTITKIVITCTATNTNTYGPKNLSGTGYTGSTGYTGTWTGSATSVSLSASAQVRFTSVVVTYLSGNCKYMVWDGSQYVVWKTQPMSQVVPTPPTIPGYISSVTGDGGGGVAWCTKPIPTGNCVANINNSSGDYKGCWRFVPNEGGAEPAAYNYPNGADVLYPVYQDEETFCFSTGVTSCNSPFGTLSATGGTTVTWSGSNINKTISLSDKKGSGTVSWSVSPTSKASISGGSSSATLTVKGAGTITVTCTIAASGDYCEESKTITITSNPQEYDVVYHLTGVTKTSGPSKVDCTQDDLEVFFNVNDGYTSDGLLGRVVVKDANSESWCYSTGTYSGCATENIELSGNSIYYINDGVFAGNVDVYITAPIDECTEPWMAFATGTNRTISYGAAGWTDAASVKVSAGGAATGQTVTYATTNSAVASVDNSGVVTIGSTAGTATISATAAKADGYCEKTVSYTVTVNCATPTTSANESGKAMTVSSVLPTSARIEGGIIVSLGGASSNTAHGFVYGTSHNPTLSDTEKGWSGTNAVPFRNEGKKWGGWNITGLTPGTTYYVRTYVTTECGGTGYSPTEVSFTTPHQYYITYDANGGTGSISDQSKLEGTNVTLSDGTGFTREGYTLQKWNTASDGGGANHTLGATYTGNANLDLYAIWQAQNYTITLNNQSATSAGTASKNVTYNSNIGLTTAINKPTKTGYTFGGYFTSPGGAGIQLIGTDGNWIANVDGYTDADKKWQYAGNLMLYAKWTANEIELELSANGGESDGSAVVLYDATGLKAGSLTHAEYEGHNLVGYYQEPAHTTKVLNSDGSFAASSVSGYITDGKWSRTATPTTLYAFWATEIRTVTFDLQDKGDDFTQDVEYNTKVSRPTPDPSHVDYNFAGWMTTAGGSTSFDFNSNITTNTTVYAKWTPKTYENLLFACVDIDLETEDGNPVLVTSRNGVNIMATKKLKVNVSGAIAGHRVTLSGNDLKFYRNDGTRFVELTGANSLTAPLVDKEVYVSYNPSITGTGAILQPDITVACDGFEETFSSKVKARNLPESVAIVARVGDTWHALPANMTTEQTPAPVMVSTETAAGLITAKGPSTVQYKLWPVTTVNSENDRFGTATAATPGALYADRLRFAGNGNDGLWANNSSSKNGIRNYADITAANTVVNNTSAYEWIVTTAEVDGQFVYTLQTQQPANNNNLRLWGNKWGTYGTYGITELYILPLTVVQTADITVMEWGTNELAVKYANAGNVASGTFKAKIGTGSQTTVTCASLGGDIYRLTGVGDLQANPAKTLILSMTEGGTPKQATFAIPLILTDSKNDAQISSLAAGGDGSTSIADGRQIARNLDVVVRSGGSLTTSTAAGAFANLYVYPAGKVSINNNIRFNNIYIRAGYSWLVGSYALPIFYVDESVSNVDETIITEDVVLDLYVNGSRYYPLSLPTTVNLAEVTDEIGNEDFNAWILGYDGRRRSRNNGQDDANWTYTTGGDMKMGIGYLIAAEPRSEVSGRRYAIVRFPLGKMLSSEKDDKIVNGLGAWGFTNGNLNEGIRASNAGWNFVGNPYLTSFKSNLSGSIMSGLLTKETFENGNWTGQWTYKGTIAYVSMLNAIGDDYEQFPLTGAEAKKIPSFTSFFVQLSAGDAVTFASSGRQTSAPMRSQILQTQPEQWVYVELMNNEQNDHTGIRISNRYAAEYEVNADLEKMFGSANNLKLYSLGGGTRLAYNALPLAVAAESVPLGYRAPKTGEYAFTLPPDVDLTDVEAIYLTDYEEGRTVDLMWVDYDFHTPAGQNDKRFALSVVLKVPKVATGGGQTLGSDSDWSFRLNGGKRMLTVRDVPEGADVYVFSAEGKLVKRWERVKGGMLLSAPVPAEGVYSVRVSCNGEARTEKTVVY